MCILCLFSVYIQLFADLYSTIRPVMREIRFFLLKTDGTYPSYQENINWHSLAITCPFAGWLDYLSRDYVWENTNFRSLERVPLTLPMNWFPYVFLLFPPLGQLCPLIYSINEILLDLKTLGPIYLLPLLPSGLMFTYFFFLLTRKSRGTFWLYFFS